MKNLNQDKCYKPRNQLTIFSRTCLSKSIIISDMTDFTKAVSCSETTHVSTKQRLAVIFAILKQEKCYIISVLKQEKCFRSTQNSIFFFNILCLLQQMSPMSNLISRKSVNHTNLNNKFLHNNANFISLDKILGTQDTFGRGW